MAALSSRMTRIQTAARRAAATAGSRVAQAAGAPSALGDLNGLLFQVARLGLNPRHILDVGANRGFWSENASGIFRTAGFTLVEPQAEMRADLDAFCARGPRRRWVQAGAGAEPGELTFTVWPDLLGSSFVPTESESASYGYEQRVVRIETIDSILAEHGLPIPELVKLDIQGFELEALRGANSLFGTTELFIAEISMFAFTSEMPVMSDVVGFFAERGYEVYDICGSLRRPFDGALGQLDVAFARRDGLLRESKRWA